ncbi:MAG: zinc ribbon domain-containing protein [Pyrinomonadaceae bacterium]|nr:zinc ribbon domain-containing protein [Pyrinomonadaceae bacterium]
MFCPNCGSEDRQSSQFCRSCGTDMRAVRQGLEKPESVMASALSAREEIGRAIAARIREVRDANDLKIVENVLPEVDKFFETPEERRLRRIRAGVVTAMCGLGGALFFFLLSFKDEDVFFLVMLGVTTFLIGLGIVLNGLLFTMPKESSRRSLIAEKEEIERAMSLATKKREELRLGEESGVPVSSVTEHTTHRLPGEAVLEPKTGSSARRAE